MAFLDVYGFSSLVSEHARIAKAEDGNPSTIDEAVLQRSLQAAITACKDRLHGALPGDVTFTAVSDCVFLTNRLPPLSDDFYGALKSLQNSVSRIRIIADHFLSAGFLLRGGVALGDDVVVDNDVVLGESVIRAVRYEGQFRAPLIYFPVRELRSELRRFPALQHSLFRAEAPDVQDREGGTVRTNIILPNNRAALLDYLDRKYSFHAALGVPNVATALAHAIALARNVGVDDDQEFEAGR